MIPLLLKRLSAKGSTRNVIWNLIGSLVTGTLLVLATPIYLKKLGLDGYGIIGLWTIMQFLMGLLDLGVGATVVREFAHSGGSVEGARYRKDLLRTLEIVCWLVAVLFSGFLAVGSGWIAGSWLKSQALPQSYVKHAIQMMALAMGLQFPFALYTNGLCGLQEQGRMNVIQVVGSVLRYGVGIGVLFWKADLIWFFAAQAAVAATQTLFTRGMVWRMISADTLVAKARFKLQILRRVSTFSIGMAANTMVGVLLGNMDRILLSGGLPTAELGRYTAAYTAASMLQMGIQPFYRAYFPRYSELVSKNDPELLKHEYFQSSSLMGIAIIPICLVALFFAPQIFLVWFGRQDEAMLSAFRWLVIGMTGAGIAWLPAAFQQANGWTRLHVGMMVVALILGTPVTLWCIHHFGSPGAAALWVVHGVMEVTVGLWLMHRVLLTGYLGRWYRTVLLPPFLVGLPAVAISRFLMPEQLSRWLSLTWIFSTGVIVLGISLMLYLKYEFKPVMPSDSNASGA